MASRPPHRRVRPAPCAARGTVYARRARRRARRACRPPPYRPRRLRPCPLARLREALERERRRPGPRGWPHDAWMCPGPPLRTAERGEGRPAFSPARPPRTTRRRGGGRPRPSAAVARRTRHAPRCPSPGRSGGWGRSEARPSGGNTTAACSPNPPPRWPSPPLRWQRRRRWRHRRRCCPRQ